MQVQCSPHCRGDGWRWQTEAVGQWQAFLVPFFTWVLPTLTSREGSYVVPGLCPISPHPCRHKFAVSHCNFLLVGVSACPISCYLQPFPLQCPTRISHMCAALPSTPQSSMFTSMSLGVYLQEACPDLHLRLDPSPLPHPTHSHPNLTYSISFEISFILCLHSLLLLQGRSL